MFCIYIYTFTHTSCVGILYHLFIITYIYNTYTKFFFAVYPRFAMNNPPCCRPAATRPLPRRRGGCKRLVACRRRGRWVIITVLSQYGFPRFSLWLMIFSLFQGYDKIVDDGFLEIFRIWHHLTIYLFQNIYVFFHEPLPSHFMSGGAQTKTSLAVNVNFQLRTKGSTSTPQETWIVMWKLPRYMGYIHFFWTCFRISHVSIPNPMYICDLGHLLR